MADEILRSRHAFGALERIQEAIEAGKVDAYDILFVKDVNGEPHIGWIDKDGNVVMLENSTDESVIKSKVEEALSSANSYTDAKLEDALGDYLIKKYEVAYKPDGAIIDYRGKEVRILCPTDTEWVLQNSGENANANMYYLGFKAYAPTDDVASFKEDLAKSIADETMYYFEGNEFAGIEADGRKYSVVWLPAAVYDQETATWTYYGASSTEDKYIGWYYSVEWFNAEGKIVASDCIRINLTNEACHSSIKPFYMSDAQESVDAQVEEAVKSANTYTDEQIAALENAYTIVEF